MKVLILTVALLTSMSASAEDARKRVDRQKTSDATKALPMAGSELRVGVKGMVCAFCAQGIEKKFRAQKEVESIQVSLENKFIKLKFKEGQRLPDAKIIEILKEAGYDADFSG